MKIKCNECNHVYRKNKSNMFECPNCGGADVEPVEIDEKVQIKNRAKSISGKTFIDLWKARNDRFSIGSIKS